LALAFLYAFVHAGAKSGTNAGLSTGGGSFGELAGYTPGRGGPEDGDGNGVKAYGVTGMTDGPGWVSTLILVVVRSEDDLLLPEDDKLAGLDVGVTEGDDSGGKVDGEWDKGMDGDDVDDVPEGVDDKDEGNGMEDEDEMEDAGAAEACAAARRMRTAEDHMDDRWGYPVD